MAAMIASALCLCGLLDVALVLSWAAWRFGAALRPGIWLRCLVAFSILTAVASLTMGWSINRFVSPWMTAWLIGVREEGLKLLFFLILADCDPETRSAGDRFLAMTAVALGFAVWEAIGKIVLGHGMDRALIGLYAASYMGIALHVLQSLQAVGFLILSRLRSRFWLAGIAIPMALHAIWDNTVLIGITMPAAVDVTRILIMSGDAVLAFGLAGLVGALPAGGGAGSRAGAIAGLSALLLWLVVPTVLQIAGLAGWRHGVTVRPYGQMMAAWWIAGLDMAWMVLSMRLRPRMVRRGDGRKQPYAPAAGENGPGIRRRQA